MQFGDYPEAGITYTCKASRTLASAQAVYFIAQTTKTSWKCSERTSMLGFILPAGHETPEPGDEDDEWDAWSRYDEPTLVPYNTH